MPMFEKPPTCYRAPISTKIPKTTLQAEIAEPRENATKHRKNAPKTSVFGTSRCFFLAFSGVLVFENPEFWPGGSGNDKRPGSRGFKTLSEFGNSSLQGYESSQNTCFFPFFGAIREERMIRDRSLLTSWTLYFQVFCHFPGKG